MWCRELCGNLSNIFDFMLCGYGVRVLWDPFFCFVTHISISYDCHAQLCFYSHFIFTAHTSLGCRNANLIGSLFDRKPDKLLPRTLYRIRVTAHVILKVREDAMNYALFAPLSNYRERDSKLTGISSKTISRIKAESENAVLAPWKP